ncbi:trimeric intracellular cation channel family protein [Arsenicitalea aurantiaca]|uniref:Trimeric intracellular cation channel family protein n=1 Tax=Arsenicitalea aurantiaca TaxID=1783274 RepID=A0A433XEM4_9HYPH|nr:trimeric intracellular cation channel family protein [Arsenicitalea aurantiaca]RUT32454.1 trimeric intracellular cation channel family protein [Arsenicitalea aurantiaca]
MIDILTFWLDWFGVAVFAITGALAASRKQMDLVGFILLGTVTGIGGGSVRDALLGNVPVFWVADPRYLLTCCIVSSVTFFLAHIPQSRYALLLRLDAVGLALFAVIGAETALLAGADPVVAIAMGVVTATFGGIIRDVLAGESPAVLRQEIYVTAALLGASLFVTLQSFGVERSIALFVGFAAALALRLGALQWHWSLPRYRPRPGRPIP